jgi:hypothetical protein
VGSRRFERASSGTIRFEEQRDFVRIGYSPQALEERPRQPGSALHLYLRPGEQNHARRCTHGIQVCQSLDNNVEVG